MPLTCSAAYTLLKLCATDLAQPMLELLQLSLGQTLLMLYIAACLMAEQSLQGPKVYELMQIWPAVQLRCKRTCRQQSLVSSETKRSMSTLRSKSSKDKKHRLWRCQVQCALYLSSLLSSR